MAVIARINRHKPRKPREPRRRRLVTVSTLPTLFTLGNLACGFAAIHFALRAMYSAGVGEDDAAALSLQSHLPELSLSSFLALAAMFVFVGIVCDMLDGALARMTRRTSDFGGQLDSLADMITSGVAPAVLVVALMMRDLSQYWPDAFPGPFSNNHLGRLVWVAALVYAVGTALRLARFNVEHTKPDSGQKMFRGLPCPGAAAVIASLVILQEAAGAGTSVHKAIIIGLPFVTVSLAILMVSRVPYVKIDQSYLRGRRPFAHVVILMVLVVVAWPLKEAALAIIVGWYALSGPIGAVWGKVRRRGDQTTDDQADEEADVDESPPRAVKPASRRAQR